MKLTRRNVVGALIGGAVVAGGTVRDALANTGAQLPTWGDGQRVAKADEERSRHLLVCLQQVEQREPAVRFPNLHRIALQSVL